MCKAHYTITAPVFLTGTTAPHTHTMFPPSTPNKLVVHTDGETVTIRVGHRTFTITPDQAAWLAATLPKP